MQCKVTPEMFWQFRRKQLGGKSAVTGQELPKTLDECNEGVQADHYSQACYAMASYVLGPMNLHDSPDALSGTMLYAVPVPPGVSADHAAKIRSDAIGQLLIDHGVS